MATTAIERRTERMADLDQLFPGRFLSLTSFRRDGTGVATPVWFGSDGTRLFAFTDLHSAKVRRVRRNPHVLVAPCRVNGKLRSEPVSARVDVLTDRADLERVKQVLTRCHPVSYRLVILFYRLGHRLRGDRSVADGAGLAITID
jgi:uncharacterized protein